MASFRTFRMTSKPLYLLLNRTNVCLLMRCSNFSITIPRYSKRPKRLSRANLDQLLFWGVLHWLLDQNSNNSRHTMQKGFSPCRTFLAHRSVGTSAVSVQLRGHTLLASELKFGSQTLKQNTIYETPPFDLNDSGDLNSEPVREGEKQKSHKKIERP